MSSYAYSPLGAAPGLVAVTGVGSSSPLAQLPPPVKRRVDDYVFQPAASEHSPLVPPMLRPGPGSAARFIVLYTLLTCARDACGAQGTDDADALLAPCPFSCSWVATFALNLPWLPWLLWADYGPPVFRRAARVLALVGWAR